MSRLPLGNYIFNRLKQLGTRHVYGVPGDYTLRALDQLNSSGLRFVGCCNELNAGYAADGYSRALRWRRGSGLGALFTTYGVGELSAANAVACSYAEYIPMVHMVGTAGAKTLTMSAASGQLEKRHLQIHHSLNDERAGVYRDIAKQFTVAQLNLAEFEGDGATEAVDWVLKQALEQSRPVYIELPVDKGSMEVNQEPLSIKLVSPDHNSSEGESAAVVESTTDNLLRRLYSAERPMILVDRGDGVEEFKDAISEFVKATGLPTLALPSGAGMIDSSLPNYYGVHSGRIGPVNTNPFVQNSDLVIAFGPMFSDTQTLGWETVPSFDNLAFIRKSSIDTVPVDSKLVIRRFLEKLDSGRVPKQDPAPLGQHRLSSPKLLHPKAPVTQDDFYLALEPHLQPNDTVILANATPIIGGRDLFLPPSTQVIASGISFSIGHMLPAALGAAQANTQGRTILLDGDGSFQVTAQELSTIIHEKINMTIFIINNRGYTYERLIHGEEEEYNDIAPWDYLKAPEFFGGAPSGYSIHTHRVQTWADLDRVLGSQSFQKGEGLTLIDVAMGSLDIPSKAKVVFEGSRKNL